jgi:hypothetical protein
MAYWRARVGLVHLYYLYQGIAWTLACIGRPRGNRLGRNQGLIKPLEKITFLLTKSLKVKLLVVPEFSFLVRT